MTTTYSAAVETLTADVHVITIGPGQLTRFMVRQLDHCDWVDLEPMGRVRADPAGEDDCCDWTDVIGRDLDTGTLVRHRAHDPAKHERIPGDARTWVADMRAAWPAVRALPLIVVGR